MRVSGRLRAALAVAVLGAVSLTGCTSVRNDLGTSSSVCYGALPAATIAVHGEGRLEGVRLVNVSSLRASAPHLYHAATSIPGPAVRRVCLVAFTGHFTAPGVSLPVGHPRGRLAVVELEYPDNRLLATLLVAGLPVHFGHSHIGVF